MVKLSEFVGGVISELAYARQMADATSVELSQVYHADTFLKEMPVPHYTVDEAEISFPLSIVSVVNGADESLEQSILDAIRLKLPALLYQEMKHYYVKKKKAEIIKQMEDQQAKQNILPDVAESKPADDVIVEIEKPMEKFYGQAANRISTHMENRMKNYLATANSTLVKPLDVKDVFMDYLQKEYVSLFSGTDPANQPVADNENLASMIKEVGTKIFFEFIHNSENAGILIDANTGRLGEYSMGDNVMKVKLKVREQDLDFVVAGDGKGRAKRFLTLN